MDFFADIFLGLAAIAAAIYCIVLSRKLSRLKGLDQDLGGAIAVLSQQVDEMNSALAAAQSAAETSSTELASMAERAEAAAQHLERLLSGGTGDGKPEVAAENEPEAPLFPRRAQA